MRPFVVHLLILTALMALGIALFAMEALTPRSGGLIQKFTITTLYWFAFIGYSLVSTCIVLSVGLFLKIKQEALTQKAVVLSHLIPIGLLWIFISLGFHDLIEDKWDNRAQEPKHSPGRVQGEQTEKKRLPTPPAPSRKILQYDSSAQPVESDKKTSE